MSEIPFASAEQSRLLWKLLPPSNTGDRSVGIGSQGNAAQVQCLYYGPPEKKKADSLHWKLTFPSETVGKYSEQHDSWFSNISVYILNK